MGPEHIYFNSQPYRDRSLGELLTLRRRILSDFRIIRQQQTLVHWIPGAVSLEFQFRDTELRAVIELCPHLPDAVKSGIAAMAKAAVPSDAGT